MFGFDRDYAEALVWHVFQAHVLHSLAATEAGKLEKEERENLTAVMREIECEATKKRGGINRDVLIDKLVTLGQSCQVRNILEGVLEELYVE
jgi:hypothetical protein